MGSKQPRSIISASARAVLRGSNRPCWRPSCRIRKAGIRRIHAGCYDGVSGAFCNVNAARISLRSCCGTQNDPRKRLRLTRLSGYAYGNVLRLPVAFRERQWVLCRLLDGLEEAVVGAYAGRFFRHEIARSMEAYLL